jgi:phosphoglycolate phosphatase
MARLIFDLDGTLVDSNPTLWATGSALLAELGRAPVSERTSAGFVGKGVEALVAGLLRHTGGVPGDELGLHVARFRALYALDPVTGTAVYPGVAEALDALAADGHGMAICTQKPNAPALVLLRELGLMPPITGFTGGDSLDVLKPDRRFLEHAAGQLPPGPVILIGDNEIDAALAVASGVPFLLHTRGYRLDPATPIPQAGAFADFAALPGLIAGVLASAP